MAQPYRWQSLLSELLGDSDNVSCFIGNINTVCLAAVIGYRAIREQEEEAAMAQFQKKASKLHHLLSTCNVPGIYRSPYQALTNTVPLLDSIPIEDQIRANRKSLVSWHSIPDAPDLLHPLTLEAAHVPNTCHCTHAVSACMAIYAVVLGCTSYTNSL